MDVKSLGLTRRPFRSLPDTQSYVPTATCEQAIHALAQCYKAHDGLALLDGGPGLGKTMTALRFLETVDSESSHIWIPSPNFRGVADFHRAILFDLGEEYEGLNDHELRLRVADLLMDRLEQNEPTVIVIDEAQHLSTELLEEIRLMGNLESRSHKATFIVLVAQPTLRMRLASSELTPIAQRIAVRSKLDALDAEESRYYLSEQLQMVGGSLDELFDDEALDLLIQQCDGIPRVLNHAAYHALVMMQEAENETVDVEAVIESLTQLGRAPNHDGPDLIQHPAASKRKNSSKRRSA